MYELLQNVSLPCYKFTNMILLIKKLTNILTQNIIYVITHMQNTVIFEIYFYHCRWESRFTFPKISGILKRKSDRITQVEGKINGGWYLWIYIFRDIKKYLHTFVFFIAYVTQYHILQIILLSPKICIHYYWAWCYDFQNKIIISHDNAKVLNAMY